MTSTDWLIAIATGAACACLDISMLCIGWNLLRTISESLPTMTLAEAAGAYVLLRMVGWSLFRRRSAA